jgi:hypothetical protein
MPRSKEELISRICELHPSFGIGNAAGDKWYLEKLNEISKEELTEFLDEYEDSWEKRKISLEQKGEWKLPFNPSEKDPMAMTVQQANDLVLYHRSIQKPKQQ